MRIAIVMDGLEERIEHGKAEISNGGVGVYHYNLVRHLRLIDEQHEYFLIRSRPGKLDLYSSSPERNVVLRPSAVNRYGHWLDVGYADLAARLSLDLFHYPNQFGGLFLPKAVKRVITLHDLTPLLFPDFHPWQRRLGFRFLLRPALRSADHVIVDAENTKRDLLERRMIEATRVTAIPLGASEGFRPGVRSDDFSSRYDVPWRFILTAGVLEPRKNHVRLIEALGRVHDGGEQVGLVIVGREGWKWRDPLNEPSLADLRPWIRIFRHVPDNDLVELYNRAEVFAYPSLYEGFGLPLLEAMACGTPVVASNASCLPDVAGGAALLADPRDARDLADKLLQCLRDPATRRRLSEAGLIRAREFSWQDTARRTLDVYRRVVGCQ